MVAAAEKAARARSTYKSAKADFGKALGGGGRLYSFPGPLADRDVYFALVRMAKAKIQETGINIVTFIDEVKSARLASKYGEMSPKELAKAKEAYAEAQKALKAADAASVSWTAHGGKHVVGKNVDWSDVIKSTKRGPAKYKHGTDRSSGGSCRRNRAVAAAW